MTLTQLRVALQPFAEMSKALNHTAKSTPIDVVHIRRAAEAYAKLERQVKAGEPSAFDTLPDDYEAPHG